MKKIVLILLLLSIVLLNSFPAFAETGTMVINNIEMTNFLPQETLSMEDELYPVNVVDTFSIEYTPEKSLFHITILQPPYNINKQAAEKDILNKLNITKNEACFLNVRVAAPNFVLQDQPEETTLSFCSIMKRVDINEDDVINTFDFATCLDELISPPEDLKMNCDFNVNRRIDATDLSSVISHLQK